MTTSHEVTEAVAYVERMARSMVRESQWLDADELASLGRYGVLHAIRSHDPSKGNFSAWAWSCAKRFMQDGVRSEGRHGYGWRRTGHVVHREAFAEGGTAAESPSPEENAASRELWEAVQTTLPAKERALVEAMYCGDETLEVAGQRMGLSKSWACRLHARAIGRLTAALEAHR